MPPSSVLVQDAVVEVPMRTPLQASSNHLLLRRVRTPQILRQRDANIL